MTTSIPRSARSSWPRSWRRRAALALLTVAGLTAALFVGANASVAASPVPVGAITALTQAPGGLHVTGWATGPTSAPVNVTVYIDHTLAGGAVANKTAKGHGSHGFSASYLVGTGMIAPGVHQVCVHSPNLTTAKDVIMVCKNITLNFNPTESFSVRQATGTTAGIAVTGWALDPDTSSPATVTLTMDGTTIVRTIANRANSAHPSHGFSTTVPTTVQGSHTVCAVTTNLLYGNGNSASSCHTITISFNPYGYFDSVKRASSKSTNVTVSGWAIDPNTTAPISVRVTIDGHAAGSAVAKNTRSDLAKAHPGMGTAHGYTATFAANTNEHTVCVTAVNVSTGTANTSLGCKIINAVHPVAPSAPRGVSATAGYGGASVFWTAPTSDGGAPWSSYTVTASPGGAKATVNSTSVSATVVGLKPSTGYTFSVTARNVAGTSAKSVTLRVTTAANPPLQTSPAPISTSRYVRNIKVASPAEQTMMRNEGVADAQANPSGHGYLILLDIGGQDQADKGVVLSAGVRFVSYTNLVTDLNAYVDGYASAQKPSAPITIAIGTNNDMDVSAASGKTWADTVVDPVVAHAASYSGVTIAGANDIEPGFRGSMASTQAWLTGYLGATNAPFVFNGSADGCASTTTNKKCNNGWTMAGLYGLSAGAAPVRIVNLPQVYNNTMAAQWKYISLTGVAANSPRINFGGALTEWTACAQAHSCGSLTGNTAWTSLWNQLRSSTLLKPASLPYSTDLRIDR